VPLSFLLHPIYEQNAAKKKSRKEKLDKQVKALDRGRAGRGRIREATSASVQAQFGNLHTVYRTVTYS
jgi:hypothetical protein